jgi:hypothetical protein
MAIVVQLMRCTGGLAPIVAQEFINIDINTIEWLCCLSKECINCLVVQIHQDDMNDSFIPHATRHPFNPKGWTDDRVLKIATSIV